ncbi:hypothetical protein [Novosphingobium sp. Gsoil 351]|uniref:hypothetical protein n=1 Tax=Novosphingobium sp. Gsoil 351 TaxID=2675225 RepID=UPI0012B455EC|nr:hypothetical protein [Novosphingobium sp. Gsoil 351]QGN55260.1 hypothetical protein GKE62_12630 [Novosphingobium sp. Gsoil 351]
MAGEAHNSQAIMAAARRSLADQRAGGRRRSIGRGSAELKARHYKAKLARVVVAVVGIVVAAMVAGTIIGGIGVEGLFYAVLAAVAIAVVLGRYPRLKVPGQAHLNQGDARTMVARTELWLENQRPALPAPAVQLVDQIGVQLDALGIQLENVAEQPATLEVRKLVGEHLPEMISTYRRIPAHLRDEMRADGRTPSEQLSDGLGKISSEIDQITRQLAAGDLDSLAVRGRFLDYKYGDALDPGEAKPG